MSQVAGTPRAEQYQPHFGRVLSAHALLRIASGANGVLIGLFLARMDGATGNVRFVGLLSAASFAAELLASVPMGMAADLWRPRWLLTGGALLGSLAAVLFAAGRSVPVFLLSRTLEGLAAAAIVPALLAYLTANTQSDAGLRARVMSYFELTLLAGLALGALVGSQLFHQLGVQAFSAIALLYLACGLLLFSGAAHGLHSHVGDAFAGLRAAWRLPALRHLLPVWLSVNCIIGLWLGPTFPFLLSRRAANGQFLAGLFAGQPQKVGTMLFGYAVVFGVGVFAWSFILPRVSIRHAMAVTLSAMLPACAGLFLFNHTAPAAQGSRWIIGSITALCVMVESGFTPAALAWLAGTLASDSGRGAAMGIYSVLLSLGAILGSLLAGVLGARYSVDGLLLGTVVVALAALLFLHWVPRHTATGETA